MKTACLRAGTAAILMLVALHAESQVFKDWAIACDNTRHCEAVGFQSEDANAQPVSLWLARDAGKGTPLRAQLMVQMPDETAAGPLTLKVGSATLRDITVEADLNAVELKRLLPHLLQASTAEVSSGKLRWTLSLAGLKAALLKMDDLQGRVDTPGALVRQGQRPETSVLPALPVPILKPMPLAPPEKGDEALLKPILKAIKERDCMDDVPDSEKPETAITRLSATQVLVLRECGRGAYQSGSGAWIANSKPPYAPRRVLFPSPSGESIDYVMNATFEAGQMSAYSKGRGLNDCGNSESWLWTAKGFQLLEASNAPLCRGFMGGGFTLRTWVAKRAP